MSGNVSLDLDCSAPELAERWKAEGSGLTEAEMSQTRVKLSRIYTAPDVFQPRDFEEDRHEINRHVTVLADALERRGKLDHLDVFPVGGMRIVVDGHCRLAAYRKAGPADRMVPVRHFRGNFEEALEKSVTANSKDKLRLTWKMKADAAWRLVKRNEQTRHWTYEKMAGIANVGRRTIARMVAVLKESCGFDPRREKSWGAVLAKLSGLEPEAWTEEREEQLVAQWAQTLRRAVGRRADKHPDLIREAARRAFPYAFKGAEDED